MAANAGEPDASVDNLQCLLTVREPGCRKGSGSFVRPYLQESGRFRVFINRAHQQLEIPNSNSSPVPTKRDREDERGSACLVRHRGVDAACRAAATCAAVGKAASAHALSLPRRLVADSMRHPLRLWYFAATGTR